MVADEFNADCYRHTYRNNSPVWDFKVREGSIEMEFSVYDEDVQEVFKDNIAYLSSTIEKALIKNAEIKLDDDEINECDLAVFKEILKKVLP